MDISIKAVDDIQVVEIRGDIDGKTAPNVQQNIIELITKECKILIDMSQVDFMSSVGLRMLLSTYRKAFLNKGSVVLVGLSEEIKDTMSITGLLTFFDLYPTMNEGLKALDSN